VWLSGRRQEVRTTSDKELQQNHFRKWATHHSIVELEHIFGVEPGIIPRDNGRRAEQRAVYWRQTLHELNARGAEHDQGFRGRQTHALDKLAI
jgi:hypothetical protein